MNEGAECGRGTNCGGDRRRSRQRESAATGQPLSHLCRHPCLVALSSKITHVTEHGRGITRAVVPARQRSGARRRGARPAQPFAISVSPSGERDLVRAFTRHRTTRLRARGPSRFRARRRGAQRQPRGTLGSRRRARRGRSWREWRRRTRSARGGGTHAARSGWSNARRRPPTRRRLAVTFRARRRGAQHQPRTNPSATAVARILADPGASGGGYRRRISPTFRCQGRPIFPPGRLLLARGLQPGAHGR
jgi:hypothetical protein